MRLSDLKTGDTFEIVCVKDEKLLEMALRLGICEGRKFTVISRIEHGPCIIQNLATSIAIGHKMAQSITVRRRS